MSVVPTYIIHFHHFRRVLDAAYDMGIDVAPLKGAHLLTSVYDESEHERLISDIDFLVRPEKWNRTLELMASFGMKPRQRGYDEVYTHEVGYSLEVSGGHTVLFEPHRYLFNPRRFPLDHAALWKRSRVSSFEGSPCRRLSTEDHIVHIALHSAIHRLMGLNQAVLDIDMLLRRGSPSLDVLVSRAREWRATRSVWLVLKLLEDRQPYLHETVKRLRPQVIPRAVLHWLVPNAEKTRLLSLHHRIQAAILWPWLMDSLGQAARYVLNHPRVLGGRVADELQT